MGHKDKRKAAAHATAARMAAFHALPSIDIEDTVIVDSNSDCGYDGGINHYWSDSGSGEYLDEDSDISVTESLEELEGVALEENLAGLTAKLKEPTAATQYEQITGPKSAK